METAKSVKELAAFFRKLPSVGNKSAYRMAYAALNLPKSDLEAFEAVLREAVEKVRPCPRCGLVIDEERCPVCDDASRDGKTLLAVVDSKDVYAIEASGAYRGKYFVLKGTLSPAKRRMPEDIGLNELVEKVKREGIQEVIAVTDKDVEGETTALYLARLLKGTGCIVTKPAQGLPAGAVIEYADASTMAEAIKGRVMIREEEEG